MLHQQRIIRAVGSYAARSCRKFYSSDSHASALVSCEWLAERLENADSDKHGPKRLAVLDSTWFLPNSDFHNRAKEIHGDNVTPLQLHQACHIPTSRFFDLDAISDAEFAPTGHNLPTPQRLAQEIPRLGIHPTKSSVVVYDQLGIFSAPRGWFTLHAFGFEEVFVLNGGLPAWKHLGLPTASSQGTQNSEIISAVDSSSAPVLKKRLGLQWNLNDVKANLEAGNRVQLLDARSQGRFLAIEPEPREGLRGGHIPYSTSVPFTDVLESNSAYGSASVLKSGNDLKALFRERGIDLTEPAALSCGSGMTAAVVGLALHEAGHTAGFSIYEGSWTEWGGLEDTPVWTADDLKRR